MALSKRKVRKILITEAARETGWLDEYVKEARRILSKAANALKSDEFRLLKDYIRRSGKLEAYETLLHEEFEERR